MQWRKHIRLYYCDIIITDIEMFSDFQVYNSTTLMFYESGLLYLISHLRYR